MAASSLTRTGETPPTVRKGHGTSELGPSDSTDSGSDVRGGPGFRDDARIGAGTGPEEGAEGDVKGAGPDLGDRDLDSDSDRGGTGERASAGRDDAGPVDHTLYDNRGNTIEGEDIADDAALDTTLQESDDRADLEPRRRDMTGDVERSDVQGTSNGRHNEPV
jgi:hypothetical protein